MTLINQSIPEVTTFTLAELLAMPSTLSGEQFPLKESAVDAIYADLDAGKALLTLPEVTTYEGINILSGGRHRTAALGLAYDAADHDTTDVTVLQYTANTADEVLERVLASNGSRRMVGAEKKFLQTSAKFGFSVLDTDALIAKLYSLPMDDINGKRDLFVTILALMLNDTYDMGDNTALVVARSLVTALKKFKVVIINPAKFDDDGTQLCKESKAHVNMLDRELFSVIEDIGYFLDTVVGVVDYLANNSLEIPSKLYQDALATGLGMVVSDAVMVDVHGVSCYLTTVLRPDALQRNAAKYVKVATPALKSYLAHNMEFTLA